jgi:hypothetical protein
MMKLRTRIEQDGITAEATMTDAPKWAEDRRDSNWYRVTLAYDGRQITVPFGMGPALTEEPGADDVLNCLASDAAGYENARSFEEWASEYGYDTDSRKAEQTYKQVEAQTAKLRVFLGAQYDAYLWQTEGL